MGKKITSKPAVGAFLRIPLDDGSFGCGRVLHYAWVAFYKYRTLEPSNDVHAISGSPLLFTLAVTLPRGQRWVRIGVADLAGAVAAPIVHFMQDLADFRKCTIFDSAGLTRDAAPAECRELERASVWEAHHVERRLLDSFMGRPNVAELHNRVRLE
jgi:Immunity protein 26